MEKKSNSTWSVIIKVVIAIASALAGVFGLNACHGLRRMTAGQFLSELSGGAPPGSSLLSNTM